MTAIAIMTLPISIMAWSACLYFAGQTINVMTLAGMTLAIGPMIDSAIICLENTHRHLGLGATHARGGLPGRQRGRHARAGLDALHVPGAFAAGVHARPGTVPVQADGDGRGVLDDRRLHPVADAGARLAALSGSRGTAPAHGSTGGGHGTDAPRRRTPRASSSTHRRAADLPDQWQRQWQRPGRAAPDVAIQPGVRSLGADDRDRHRVLRQGTRRRAPPPVPDGRRGLRPAGGDHSPCMWPIMRRDFFPEVDAGAFEMYVRAQSGTRIEKTEEADQGGRGFRPEDDRGGRPPARFSPRSASPPTGRPLTR